MVNRYSGGACSATVSEADGEVALGALLDKDVAFPVSITRTVRARGTAY